MLLCSPCPIKVGSCTVVGGKWWFLYYVYILKCSDGTFYTGIALDLQARVKKHHRGVASKYTRSRLPAYVVYLEIWPDRAGALRRENAIKKMTRLSKLRLIQGQAKPQGMVKTMFLISACLAGEKCRYTGDGFDYPVLRQLVAKGLALSVCPEVLGGAPVPRDPCEIKGGDGFDVLDGQARVVDCHGRDQTEIFIRGARKTLAIAKKHGAPVAILKERSPSCGGSIIYDGTFSGNKKLGLGCSAAILQRAGLKIYSEQNFQRCLESKK